MLKTHAYLWAMSLRERGATWHGGRETGRFFVKVIFAAVKNLTPGAAQDGSAALGCRFSSPSKTARDGSVP
jgi:hypothetical protein